MRAKIEGREYDIPEMWLVGFCQSGAHPADAVRHWHAQVIAKEQYDRERAAVGDGVLEVGSEEIEVRRRQAPRGGRP